MGWRIGVAIGAGLLGVIPGAAEDGAPAADARTAGLRLRLSIVNSRDGGQDVHDFRLELENAGPERVEVSQVWVAEGGGRTIEDDLRWASLTIAPEVRELGCQTMSMSFKYAHRYEDLPPHVRRAVTWRTLNGEVGGVVATEPGRYEVRARVNLTLRGGRTVVLDSNPQAFVVGGSDAPARPTVATIVSVNRAAGTVELDLGTEHGVRPGDAFSVLAMGYGFYKLRVERADPRWSVARVEFDRRTGFDEKTAWENVRPGEKGDRVDPRREAERAVAEAAAQGRVEDVRRLVAASPDVVRAGPTARRHPLHEAAARGDLAMVRELLHLGFDVGALGENVAMGNIGFGAGVRGNSRVTPLHAAVAAGKADVAAFLLDQGADVRARSAEWLWFGGEGVTALHWAAQGGDAGLVRLLLSRGADPKAPTDEGFTPLHGANGPAAAALLAAGADANARTKDGRTPLHAAACAAAAALLTAGADANARTNDGRTPLHFTAMRGDLDAIEALLGGGADARAVDGGGRGALYHAASSGHAAAAKRLAQAGAPCDLWSAMLLGEDDRAAAILRDDPAQAGRPGQDAGLRGRGWSTHEMPPLHWAVRRGRRGLLGPLLAAGASVDARDRYGRTPLHWAARAGDADAAKALLDKGADADARDGIDQSAPLHLAVAFERAPMAALLAGRGADVNARTIDGETPLHGAAATGQTEVVRRLLEAGARPGAANADGETPLIAMARARAGGGWFQEPRDVEMDERATETHRSPSGEEFREVARLLLARKAGVNAANAHGTTALHYAATSKDSELAAILLKAGADPNAQDDGGRTPLHIAAGGSDTWGFSESAEDGASVSLLRLLLDHGADARMADEKGNTPLHAAVRRGAGETRMLLDRGADVAARNREGRTALHEAAERGSVKIVGLLLEHRANVGARDAEGRTPLHVAARAAGRRWLALSAFQDVARLLIERGADRAERDGEGMTALHALSRYRDAVPADGDRQAAAYDEALRLLTPERR